MEKILVIEDNKNLAKSMKLVMEEEGYKVKLAYRGYDVLAILKTDFIPDAIVLDLFIPDLSGIELLSSLKLKYPKARICIFSGHIPSFASRVNKEKAINNTICGVFTKATHGIKDIMSAIKSGE